MDVGWPECSSDIFELIADEHDVTQVSCFTINAHGHCKYSANITRITFKGQDKPYSAVHIKDFMEPLIYIFCIGNKKPKEKRSTCIAGALKEKKS